MSIEPTPVSRHTRAKKKRMSAQTFEVSKTSEVSRDIAAIREQIVHDPIAGAEALSNYLASHPKWALKQAEVDLKRTELAACRREHAFAEKSST